MVTQTKEIPYLDGTRAIACLIVFVSHSANSGMLPSFLGYGFGQIGVMIFFVLSGFLMGRLYLDKAPRQSAWLYLKKRMVRVFPLYYFVLLASLFISYFKSAQALYYYYFDLENLSVIIKALAMISSPKVLWSIPVEVQFYLAFLLIWLAFSRTQKKIQFIGLIVATLICASIVSMQKFSVKMYGFSFALGLLLHIITHQRIMPKFLKRIFDLSGFIWLVLICANLPNLGTQEADLIFKNTWHDFYSWALILFFFFSVIIGSKTLSFLDLPALKYLGRISYGFYVYHYIFIFYFANAFGESIHPLVKFVLSFVITIIVSHASFYCFESRILGRKQS